MKAMIAMGRHWEHAQHCVLLQLVAALACSNVVSAVERVPSEENGRKLVMIVITMVIAMVIMHTEETEVQFDTTPPLALK